jgi:transposase
LQALHRVRDCLITRRTSVINQLRAFLLERGLVFAKSPARLRERMPEILENAEEDLTPRMRNLLALLWNELKDLELQIVQMNDEGSQTAEGFCRTGTRRISSWPGEQNLHKQAGYIDADFPSSTNFSLAVGRRTIH